MSKEKRRRYQDKLEEMQVELNAMARWLQQCPHCGYAAPAIAKAHPAAAAAVYAAPFRALIGWKSDQHRSALGWRRVPYVWMGSGLQFAGLAIMPFAIVLLGGETAVQLWAGHLAAALAFLLAGGGAQIVQTAGLALATDRASAATRPRVVALMYVMLLLGMVGCGALFGLLLTDYSATRLVQVVQATAVATLLVNLVAVWKQEARDRGRAREPADRRQAQSCRVRALGARSRDGPDRRPSTCNG